MIIQKPRLPLKQIILVGFLPGFLKKLVYRIKGYKIGKNVSLGFGSVIIADRVSIGAYTSIGFLTIIRGKEISLGEYVSIGSMSFLDTPYVEIGNGSKINEQVFVGGLQFPDSKFVMGKNCQIMQMCFINPARLITIGDDSGIGGSCHLFGHTSWLSYFEGYPVDFQSIEIGKSVSIAWNVFILPGSKIGYGAVIGANSLVNRTVPPKCLAIGFPAKVVSKYPDFPREVSENEKPDMLRKIISEMTEYFAGHGLKCSAKNGLYTVSGPKKKHGIFTAYYEVMDNFANNPTDIRPAIIISLKKIPDTIRQTLNENNIMWIDIAQKDQSDHTTDLGDEIVLFLRRYGVRFTRIKEDQCPSKNN